MHDSMCSIMRENRIRDCGRMSYLWVLVRYKAPDSSAIDVEMMRALWIISEEMMAVGGMMDLAMRVTTPPTLSLKQDE